MLPFRGRSKGWLVSFAFGTAIPSTRQAVLMCCIEIFRILSGRASGFRNSRLWSRVSVGFKTPRGNDAFSVSM